MSLVSDKLKIGITLSFPSNEGCLFNNGLLQNALFFYKLLVNIGKYDIYFIVDKKSSEGEKYLDKMNYKYIKEEFIIDACFNIVFTFGYFLPTNICLLLKENGIKQIFYNCGNFFIMDSETCLFQRRKHFIPCIIDFNILMNVGIYHIWKIQITIIYKLCCDAIR